MVGDDDTLALGKQVQALHAEWHTRQREERPRHAARDGASALDAWNHEKQK